MSKIRLEEIAKQRIESFAKLGKAHLYLAYHAAFPLALTPDLLYRLWVQFQRDIDDQVLGIPWVAVADLLVSSLCNEVGYELYEMDLTVRNLLLSRLQEDKKFGQQRINELSNFLLDYVRPKLESKDPDIQDFALTQQWTALAYTQPNKVAHELALEFDKLDFNNEAELIRIVSLTEIFAQPLAEFDPLLSYARGMGKLARGNLEAATDQVSKILEGENKIRVAGVDLPIPEKIKANLPELFEQLANHKNALKRSRISSLFFLSILALGTLIGGTGIYIFRFHTSQLTQNSLCPKETYSLNDRISLGEEILLKQDTNSDKEAGVQAFLNGDCQTAINKLNLYRKANSTDPEALIYLNNAKARQKENRLKIAVSVPIGTNPNVAKEILRGVAQAQDEVNSSGSINGKALEVAIANDDNDPSESAQLATRFGKDTNILAVVGHNSSNASLSAAPVYQRDGLVMISPTSFAQNLTSVGNYIFRTAPSVKSIADSVSYYAIKIAGKTNFLICVDYQGIDNQSFKSEFVKAIKAAGSQINSTECDISARDFNPSVVISQAVSSGANALVLGLYIDKIKQGLAVAESNQGQLTVFGSPTLFTDETLKNGSSINGLIISAPWYPAAFPNNIFPQKAQKLWGATVNWRTATAYDATLAIIAGLQRTNTNRRDELQKVLHSPSFSVDGATGKIQFSPSGDRTNNAIFLVKVQQIPGTDNYEFVPIQP
ncbi:MAG: ABC transporter substrate-binding protein [Nostoc sp. DedSLP03]|uniref:ABC transporter substrate-binding protein n=1 Tax=Nostoc sp. DedSLP03 TaxID=3075400 RepID=UPI002AD432CE|nr:ABC transporter substrate-binding protein [Nostoc sp. DedSLP03]MDZ7965094.1 ABC transporter substrate-binding protein [Nostoc sp. DedSLP03]